MKKHKLIRGSDKYFTLYISSNFDSLEKMKESKGKLKRSGKVLITSLGFKIKSRSQKYKKASYAIINISEKDIYNIIREFDKSEKLYYEKKRPKHEPNDCYFYLA